MNAERQPSGADEINRLHEAAQRFSAQSRQTLETALVAAWQAGQLLLAEKKRVRHSVGPGSWLFWLEANFRGTPRTAQRYMKLARSVADAVFLQGMSLRQAYARLGIATEPKTPARNRLAHQLPAHLVLANKLLRALKTVSAQAGGDKQSDAIRRDLRMLFEVLLPWFAGSARANAGRDQPRLGV